MSEHLRKTAVRLTLRAEGKWWNAYIAQQGTMDGAFQIGSILLASVTNNPDRKQHFIELMSSMLGDAVEIMTGRRPEMIIEPAPESERAGNA